MIYRQEIVLRSSADSLNWKNHEAKFYATKQDFSWLHLMLPTLIITMIIGVFGAINLQRL